MSRSTASKGNQSKILENNYWYKADALGFEGMSEFVVSTMLDFTDVPHARYELCKFKLNNREFVGCKSKNFLKSDEELISLLKVLRIEFGYDVTKIGLPLEQTIEKIITDVQSLGVKGFDQYLADTLVIDALTLNDDRHFRNLALIKNNTYSVAPIFDNGGAFLSDEYSYNNNTNLEDVQAKPFSIDFDEQVTAIEHIKTSQIKVPSADVILNKVKTKCLDFYTEKQFTQVERVLRARLRTYNYLVSKT